MALLVGVFFVPFFEAQAEEHVYCEDLPGGIRTTFLNFTGFVPCGRPCDVAITSWDETAMCNTCHFVWMLTRVYQVIVWWVAPTLAGLFFIIGGFMFLTAGGSQERVSKAKAMFKATVIGLIIVFASWILVNTIITSDLVSKDLPGFQKTNWHEFICQ